MPDGRNQDELFGLVSKLNERESDLSGALLERFGSRDGEGLREEIRAFQSGLRLADGGSGFPPTTQPDLEGDRGRAFVEVLSWHPGAGGRRELEVGIGIFTPDEGALDPA